MVRNGFFDRIAVGVTILVAVVMVMLTTMAMLIMQIMLMIAVTQARDAIKSSFSVSVSYLEIYNEKVMGERIWGI